MAVQEIQQPLALRQDALAPVLPTPCQIRYGGAAAVGDVPARLDLRGSAAENGAVALSDPNRP